MFSFACKISEEALLPEVVVTAAKQMKSVVEKYDAGMMDKATTKFDVQSLIIILPCFSCINIHFYDVGVD